MALNSTWVDVDQLTDRFVQLEKKIIELNGRNILLDMKLDDNDRALRLSLSKEKCLTEDKQDMLSLVTGLQNTVTQQCKLREDNERLKDTAADMREQNKQTTEFHEAKMQMLLAEMTAEEERHEGQLETVRQQSKAEFEERRRDFQHQLAVKDAELKKVLEIKVADMEELNNKLRTQERESQSDLLKLQLEFGTKLSKMQSAAQFQEKHQCASCAFPQHMFKRKLQSLQEEKNRETEALRQRIRELEAHQQQQQQQHQQQHQQQQQRASASTDNRLKRMKM